MTQQEVLRMKSLSVSLLAALGITTLLAACGPNMQEINQATVRAKAGADNAEAAANRAAQAAQSAQAAAQRAEQQAASAEDAARRARDAVARLEAAFRTSVLK
jgi:sensor c-di-GMP phosphodiesterase-like protein